MKTNYVSTKVTQTDEKRHIPFTAERLEVGNFFAFPDAPGYIFVCYAKNSNVAYARPITGSGDTVHHRPISFGPTRDYKLAQKLILYTYVELSYGGEVRELKK